MSRLGPYELDSIVVGDNLDVMPRMPKNCVDTIITDPPYGLEFMGKEWDKLGAYQGPLAENEEEGPWGRKARVRYGASASSMQQWHHAWAVAALRVAKPGAIMLAFGGSRTHHRLMCAIEDAGWEIRDCIFWVFGSGFPKSHDISKAIDKAAGAEREVVARRTDRAATPVSDFRGGKMHAGGTTPGVFDNSAITAPATPAAQLWDGWGTALKPAYEIIIVAMKPRDGTFANNALKWGVAGLWIDGGRVEGQPRNPGFKDPSSRNIWGSGDNADLVDYESPKGRWPSNLLHDGSEEVVAGFPETGSGKYSGIVSRKRKGHKLNECVGPANSPDNYGDNGSAARFFYCAKASRAERDAGLDELPDSVLARSCQAIAEAKRGNTVEREGGAFNKARVVKNNHPTVKPLALMEYLCRLTKTPTGGLVFDPFAGSGTTLLAARIQGRHYFGCDISEEYVEIARQRLRSVQPRLI